MDGNNKVKDLLECWALLEDGRVARFIESSNWFDEDFESEEEAEKYIGLIGVYIYDDDGNEEDGAEIYYQENDTLNECLEAFHLPQVVCIASDEQYDALNDDDFSFVAEWRNHFSNQLI